ncbi:50S ribosomal protein L22 [bacterium BMS3Abin15]|nr:50S ribosomal protein L22 [bacterium BMS3Abin15]
MKAIAKISNLRISPKKVRLVAGLVKGLDVSDARVYADNTIKKSSPYIIKLLNSAIANAENNFGLDKDNLYIYDIQVGEGVKLKRWMPRAYGRATMILKRSSNVLITLEERVEGKNRKTKEQLAKEKKEREEARKKEEKEIKKEKKEEEKDEEKTEEGFKKEFKEEKEAKRDGQKGGWMKKIFRRKSG